MEYRIEICTNSSRGSGAEPPCQTFFFANFDADDEPLHSDAHDEPSSVLLVAQCSELEASERIIG
eukprot:scaffold21730_cov116-Skeletonema_dohrnii-CCMP3373.AAC.3